MMIAMVTFSKPSTLGHVMDVLSTSVIVSEKLHGKLTWGKQLPNMWQLQAAVIADHYLSVCNKQYGQFTVATDWGMQLKWWMFTITSTGQANRLSFSYCSGSCWWEAGKGNSAVTVAEPCGCTQLLISVCMGLYRPEVRIQYSRLSYTAPLTAPKPVNPSHLVPTVQAELHQWSQGDT